VIVGRVVVAAELGTVVGAHASAGFPDARASSTKTSRPFLVIRFDRGVTNLLDRFAN
jgi:hypothetical protein